MKGILVHTVFRVYICRKGITHDIGVIGKKVGMTQIFDSEGLAVPVTVIKVDSIVVTQVKTVETDGYNAIQLVRLQLKKNI